MSRYETAESLAKVFSLIALPVLLAIGGWFVQSSISESAAKTEYIKIAVGILQEKPANSDNNKNLRRWATQTLDHYSEIPFTSEESKGLQEGDLTLPQYEIKMKEAFQRSFDSAAKRILDGDSEE